MEVAAAANFLIPGSEIGFPEAVPGSLPPESTKGTRAFDIRWRERKRMKNKSVRYSPRALQGLFLPERGDKWGLRRD